MSATISAPVRDVVQIVDLQTQWESLHSRWDEYVNRHPKGSIFHTADMVRVFSAARRHSVLPLAAVNGDGEILALLVAVRVQTLPNPLGSISSRSIWYAEPICDDDECGIEALTQLVSRHDEIMSRNTLFTEIRPLCADGAERVALERCGYEYLEYLNYIVDVASNPDVIWKRMRRDARRSIKKSEAAGYQVQEVSTPGSVDLLYEFVQLSYANAKVPFADKSLFEAAFKTLHPKKQLRIITVERDGETVTAHAVLIYKDRAFAWYIGNKRQARFSPVDILKWREFVWSHENGLAKFDMGGAGWPDEEYGVRDFKAKFGGDLVRFGRYRKTFAPVTLAFASNVYGVKRRLQRLLGSAPK